MLVTRLMRTEQDKQIKPAQPSLVCETYTSADGILHCDCEKI